ncbi:helix-turn-helix transcriptional regulator [Actinocorallia longicatena]|uniref:Helix-turn-helix transcriptional regulator n=1 Tax=Actinocorallia longicatena TaxID=111803 RepID=A0ABP6QAG9_9ACTN
MIAQSEPLQDPAVKAFAITLRAFREKGGLGKKELAELLGYTPGYLSQVESAKNTPSVKFAEDLNTFFGTDAFTDLQQNMSESKGRPILPRGFEEYVEREAQASILYVFEMNVVKGIFQTPEYAREILWEGRTAEELDQVVATRLDRQGLLTRDAPPQIVAIFDEGAVRRMIGGGEVMKAQIARLIEIARMPSVQLHIVPASKGAYPGVQGSFTILEFIDAPRAVYTEGHAGGTLTEHPLVVHEHALDFNAIRGAAKSADDSLELLHSVLEGL